MLGFRNARSEAEAVLDALGRSLAIIEFDPSGRILKANRNFCDALGYSAAEIESQHHSMFVETDYARSREYREFWPRLASGQFDSGEYRRFGKGGREVWIQASYNPVLNARGAVIKIVKVAAVTTAAKLQNAEFEGKLNAITLVQAIIEFTRDGEILTANENFLKTVGYTLDEIKGQHHRMFVEPEYARSPGYREFWSKLNAGEYVSASFKRFGKGGREVWIQASYNPIFDLNGRVIKVVKFATDISDLTEIAAGLARMANNDLARPIEKSFIPAYEKLRHDFNSASGSLRTTLVEIAHGADRIRSATDEIASSSDHLSRRTEQQAASLEQTAAALDEITATIKKSAAGADHARRVVAATDDDARRSAIVVRQAVGAMSAIAQSSRGIEQIIGVIDEIAFQTNLLALNAGVEAARAGEAGRGFAVVASEVRTLAQKSAEAAKQIKDLISSSATQVGQGVSLVAETGTSLERILAQVSDINAIVADIAAGAGEQSIGLAEVNTAVNQMDQVTQQNAAMAEQSKAASHALVREAEHVADLVSKFQIGSQPRPLPDPTGVAACRASNGSGPDLLRRAG